MDIDTAIVALTTAINTFLGLVKTRQSEATSTNELARLKEVYADASELREALSSIDDDLKLLKNQLSDTTNKLASARSRITKLSRDKAKMELKLEYWENRYGDQVNDLEREEELALQLIAEYAPMSSTFIEEQLGCSKLEADSILDVLYDHGLASSSTTGQLEATAKGRSYLRTHEVDRAMPAQHQRMAPEIELTLKFLVHANGGHYADVARELGYSEAKARTYIDILAAHEFIQQALGSRHVPTPEGRYYLFQNGLLE